MIQKKTISLIEGVLQIIRALPKETALRAKGLLNSLASFDVISDINLETKHSILHPHLAVIHNLVTRGLPTYSSIFVEEKIALTFGRTIGTRDEILGEFYYNFKTKDKVPELILDALHIVDPRLQLSQNEYNTSLLGSAFESSFVFRYLTGNDQYLRQLLLPQRNFTSIVKPERARNHAGQRVDFCVEVPYLQKVKSIDHFGTAHETLKHAGYIIEIDGPQHWQTAIEDNNRDADAKEALWSILRVRSGSEQTDINNALQILRNDPYLNKCNEISKRALAGEWKDYLQIILSPVAVSRLQSVFTDYLLSHTELLKKERKLNIAVIEWDVPCGKLAFADFLLLESNLQKLSADPFNFPEVSLDVYSSPEFVDSKLHISDFPGRLKKVEEFPFQDHNYDLVLDISVLRRSLTEKNTSAGNYIRIRSSHFTEHDNQRVIYTSKSINYKPLVKKLHSESYELIRENVNALEFFLKYIFRKLSFLEGQLPILNRALQNLCVIGLLPTGGGKSLTYQLASLLQPGIVLVVDPIKSLMQDQYQNLVDAGIDTAVFINSTLTTTERKISTARFSSGESMFCFVSPERLIIKEFRDALMDIHKKKIFFSYCVIDEVHCVSEWGHDFRTAYLSLGKNAVDYCKTATGNPLPIFGLTATASFDVLADVERELSYKNNIGVDAIVRRENTIRDEIQYRIIESEGDFEVALPFTINGVTVPDVGPLKASEFSRYNNTYIEKDVNSWKVKELIGVAKRNNINELIAAVPEDISDRFNENELKSVLDQSFEKFLEERDLAELFDKYKIASGERELLKKSFIQDHLERIRISNLDPGKFYDDKCRNACLIFCPHRAWYFGVTDKYKWQKYPGNVLDDKGNILYRRGEYVRDADGNRVPAPLSERKGIADMLTIPGLKIGTFIGSGGDNEKDEKTIQEESFRNQDGFINNHLNMMVATKAFGMGINKRNIRCTMHLNMPSSLEGFIQEGGRAGRDRKIAMNYILVNRQKFSVWDLNARNKLILANKKEGFLTDLELTRLIEILNPLKDKYFYKEHFEQIIKRLCESFKITDAKAVIDNIPVIDPDRDILMYFHNRSFKGKEKEKAVLFELRDRITYPNISRLKILEEKIKEELLIDELTLSVWHDERVYFNVGFHNSFGFLSLGNLQYTAQQAKGYESLISDQVLQMALEFFNENYTGGDDRASRAEWLNSTQLLEPESGIERWVLEDTVPVGAEKTLRVHFENLYCDQSEYQKRLEQFWNKVIKDKKLHLNPKELAKQMPEEEDVEQYVNIIENEFKVDIYDLLSENELNALKIRYYCIRKKEDTDKAIFRLQSMGLIEDYTVDYNDRMYSVKVVKRNTIEYVERLFEFIKRYYSEVKARREIEKIDQSDERFIIRNCINFLTDFIYDEIEKKRRVAADDMNTACETGTEEGNLGFKEFVYTYFNSKFARLPFEVNGVDYSLLSEKNTDNGKIYSFEVVWKFINAVNGEIDGSQVDNLKHLRGACLRILRSNPDNAALNLLKAYSLFILAGNNEKLFPEASDAFFKGFREFRIYYKDYSTPKFNKMIEKYKELILEHTTNIRVIEMIENQTRLLYLQLTADRFHEFKIQFLKDYGRKTG